MTDITIPPEALEAAAKAAYVVWVKQCATMDIEDIEMFSRWEDLADEDRRSWLDQHRAACLAMLSAWPEAWTQTVMGKPMCYSLPLPKEPSDADK